MTPPRIVCSQKADPRQSLDSRRKNSPASGSPTYAMTEPTSSAEYNRWIASSRLVQEAISSSRVQHMGQHQWLRLTAPLGESHVFRTAGARLFVPPQRPDL